MKPSQFAPLRQNASQQVPDEVALCIIGAGIAGLNALFSASQYLERGDRILLIDKRPAAGGMWNDVYSYGRLHQPHPSFTVGDIPWDWDRPVTHRATAAEVRKHMGDCLEKLRRKTECIVLWGHEVSFCAEVPTEKGIRVELTYGRTGKAERRIVRARRVIKAAGFDINALPHLPLHSSQVVSTTPEWLGPLGHFYSEAPVYLVGGGKTAMDTADELLRRNSGRRVTLINGKGSVFAERDQLMPAPHGEGRLFASLFRDLALRYDGTNEDDLFEHFRRQHALGLDGKEDGFFFGLLSREERDRIASGLTAIVPGYLKDVLNGPEGPMAEMWSGRTFPVEKGAIFVNCTGHLLRGRKPYEPYVSDAGCILSIGPRSMVHFLSSMAGYLLPHLWLSGRLDGLPLYEVDGPQLRALGQKTYMAAMFAMTFHNTILMQRVLPPQVAERCGLDLDMIHAPERRAAAMDDVRLNGARYIAQCRKALDRTRERHGIRCGILGETVCTARQTAEPLRRMA
ncbi:NAD(P)-binding protein [Croceicoccus sp. Ery5]|uniref:NAD(P)-binding protein n=1 Tax=Croceicoccus sp. Ery5 TaxID=1703340 RepID=UPI001E4F9BE8|nr:NAD(P)-binding protein [Croceicoccus sp. Ery5]